MKKLLLLIGLLLLLAAEILRVYFIMPFPGSQESTTINIAYFLDQYIWYIRIILWLLIAVPLYRALTKNKTWAKILVGLFLVLYGLIFYAFNFKFLADKMFYQPQHKTLAAVAENKVGLEKLVIGVALNGEAKAYPIEIIGYHHQVQDTLAGQAIMVTYCTVCRTGRVFSPFVKGKKESFRLVGMDHFNAMFEDATTKSWWRQATGEAIAGPLKGMSIPEIPSQQSTLAAWLRAYPASRILQPDSIYQSEYDSLAGYDKGTLHSSLEKRDSGSWKKKSWVVGVAVMGYAKAYDWNDLVNKQIIQDSLPALPLLITLEKDTATFHVWSRTVNGQILQFIKNNDTLLDTNTQSSWNEDGVCVSGRLNGQRLKPVQASQEFWHSWEAFHPGTQKYQP
ncbi:MAG: DUF3179 domain-containing (seleno)protein [Panacibacter sp.]